MKKIKVEIFFAVLVFVFAFVISCTNAKVKSTELPLKNIKIMFDRDIIYDDKFDYESFLSNITNPSFDIVNQQDSLKLDSVEWYNLYNIIISESNKEGVKIESNDLSRYNYGEYKIYIMTENGVMILINNDNDIFSFEGDKIIKNKNDDFANKMRAVIDYYNYFPKETVLSLNGGKEFLRNHKFSYKKVVRQKPFLYHEIDIVKSSSKN